jgi:hypothetical protein
MTQAATALAAATVGNVDDAAYDQFLHSFNAQFLVSIGNGEEPLFTTDAEDLFTTYLTAFGDPADRQQHTCSACRHFLTRYAGLVTIDAKGLTTPALLSLEPPEHYRLAFERMARIVRGSKVTGVFLSSDPILGTPVTGRWRHLAVTLPVGVLHNSRTQTAGQAMAEKREDYKNVQRALAEFSPSMLETALTLLESDQLYRAEKVIGPAQWLRDVHKARDAAMNKANILWRWIATAPAGFCHPRSSMIGTLLEDIAAGMTFEQVSRRFAEKMHPLLYQRPQAAPAAGTIAQAEKVVEQLKAAGSLARRFARPDEVIDTVWKPHPAVVVEAPKAGGVFAHLKPKDAQPGPIEMAVPAQVMTWAKFASTVLPTAETIEFLVPFENQNYTAFVTAVNADAPPILQWDHEEHRNPVSWYVWHGGSSPSQWGLASGKPCTVWAIALQPSMWGDSSGKFTHQGQSVIFLLQGARETRRPGACLFPEFLKREFHGIRSVIEAHSRSTTLEGLESDMACGLMLHKSGTWSHVFRVSAKGRTVDYKLDRWD